MTWPAMAVGLAATAAGAWWDMKGMEVPYFVLVPAIPASLALARLGLSPVWWFESLVCGTGMFLLMGLWCLAIYLARRLSGREPRQDAVLGGADLLCSALSCFVFGTRGVWVSFFAFILATPFAAWKFFKKDKTPYPFIPFYLVPYIAVMLTYYI